MISCQVIFKIVRLLSRFYYKWTSKYIFMSFICMLLAPLNQIYSAMSDNKNVEYSSEEYHIYICIRYVIHFRSILFILLLSAGQLVLLYRNKHFTWFKCTSVTDLVPQILYFSFFCFVFQCCYMFSQSFMNASWTVDKIFWI